MATLRHAEVAADSALSEWLTRLRQQDLLDELLLAGLGEADVATLVEGPAASSSG